MAGNLYLQHEFVSQCLGMILASQQSLKLVRFSVAMAITVDMSKVEEGRDIDKPEHKFHKHQLLGQD